MKVFNFLFVVTIFLGGCSSPKKITTKEASPTVTRTDILLGGTSFKNALVIMVESESVGLREEYKWLSNSYPGYGLIRRTQVEKSPKHYDIIRIKTRQGYIKDIYFDSTHFWGKP